MDLDEFHVDTAKVADFKARVHAAEAHLDNVSCDPDAPDHLIWRAQAALDQLRREYDAYLQSFRAP